MAIQDDDVQSVRRNPGRLQNKLGKEPILWAQFSLGTVHQACQTGIVRHAILVVRDVAFQSTVIGVEPRHGDIKSPANILKDELQESW